MNFELHKSFRWRVDYDERDYLRAKRRYFEHLRRIPFPPRSALLRYFGHSFFHDATLTSLAHDNASATIRMTITTLNDLEDINTYRERHHLTALSRSAYVPRPIRYICTFAGVTGYRPCSSRTTTIMDTELTYSSKTKDYILTVSFSPRRELMFRCTSCRVSIDSPARVAVLTGGVSRIPRCSACNGKLLNPRKIASTIKKWSNQAL